MFVSRHIEEFWKAKELIGSGRSIRATARTLGLAYSTVQRWHCLVAPPGPLTRVEYRAWRPPDAGTYAYLLGLYLGDGTIGSTSPRRAQLSITLDTRYPTIIAAAREAI